MIVCGGGPAGLAAALWLGRYRRDTVILDAGGQRNRRARASHGYLTRDGCEPGEFLDVARAEATSYETVRLADDEVRSVSRGDDGFVLRADESEYRCRRLVLTTGVSDVHPDLPGFDDLYGRAIFHCSCCDGYETRGMDVIAIGWAEHSAGYALDLLDWGARVTLVTNGNTFEGDASSRDVLVRHGIELVEERVEEMLGENGAMTGARLSSGRVVEAQRAFFSIEHRPHNELARSLGCEIDDLGYVSVGPHGETSVEHVYAAGDITPGEQLVIVAAAEGAVAGIACAMSLRGETSASKAPDPGPDPVTELEQ